MVGGLGGAVSFEMRKAAVCGAVGMTHHEDAFALMQADRHANLLEDEVLLEVVAWRSQRLCSPGDDNHVGALDALLLQKFSHRHADAMIEAA